MKAVVVEQIGGPEVLQFKTSYPVPTPQAGQLLVRNNISGVNYIDTYFRTGLYPAPKPEILGREGAGVVAAVGPGTSGFQVGDRVAWLATGGYAEYTAVPAAQTAKIPEGISDEDIMASFLSGLTVLAFAKETYPVQQGDWVLLHAAAGGAGFLMTQILKTMGAKVMLSTIQSARIPGKEAWRLSSARVLSSGLAMPAGLCPRFLSRMSFSSLYWT